VSGNCATHIETDAKSNSECRTDDSGKSRGAPCAIELHASNDSTRSQWGPTNPRDIATDATDAVGKTATTTITASIADVSPVDTTVCAAIIGAGLAS
jgi:hypothetical protein